jgi:hypothetical protein
MGDAGLQVEGGGLGRPLLVVGKPGKAGGEGIGYAELHYSAGRLSPVLARHDAQHEFIKHWDCKSGVTVTRTPDHAFGNQLTSHWG